jgi:hypothetical protein
VKKLIPVAAVCLTMTAACSLSHIQAPRAEPARAAVSISPFTPGSIGANGPVVGVNLYAVNDYTAAQTETDAVRTLSYIKNTLHADAVDIVWNMYTPTPTANQAVTEKATTLTAQDVGIVTKLAQQKYHLQVEYRPMMFVQRQTHWAGTVNPTDPAKWFGSYYAANVPYLQEAQKHHVNEYVIATEMVDLTPYNTLWEAMIAKAARLYKGQISVTAHEAYYFPPHFKVPATRLTGFDYYEKLPLPATAPLSAVTAAYEKYFLKAPAALLRRTAIQETGIAAVAGAYANPADIGQSGTIDETVQRNWFFAGCAAVKRFHLRGIFYWKVDLADFPLTPAKSPATFEGRTAAHAVARCATILHPPRVVRKK